jgi:serine phosphatase RsbU (regulator of sigma subunit)
MKGIRYILIVFLFSAFTVHGKEVIPFSRIVSGESIEPYVEVYKGRADSITDVSAANDKEFSPYSWDSVPSGKSVFWLRFTVLNEDNYDEKMVLGNNQYQFIAFYELQEDSSYRIKLGGSLCDHNVSEMVFGASSWFSLTLPAGKTATFYLRVSNDRKIKYQYSKLPFSLYTDSDFTRLRKRQTFFNYFFWGALIIITLYNLVLFFQLRGRIYLFYVFNNIAILIFVLCQSGLVSELFLSNSNHHEDLILVFGNFAFIFYVLFCKEFLDLKAIRPKLNRIFNRMLVFWPLPLLLLPLNLHEIAVSIGGLIAIWAYTMIMVTAWRSIKRGDTGARFFFIANLFYYIGTILSILMMSNVLPPVLLGMYAINLVQLGTLLQVTLFSLTVGSRILKMQREITEKQLEQERIKMEEEVKRTKLIREQNQLLEKKVIERTAELDNQREIADSRRIIAEEQRFIIEEKQKEILDSINYAKRIQYTLLANDDLLNKYLPPHFILFNPKDIVSGDFYWAIHKDNKFFFAVCDCTGHGVPGAFMSLLNISFLNEAITEKNILEPHNILNYVREKLIVSQAGARDGMDGTLLCFTEGSDVIEYASAYNKPILVRDKIIVQLTADKMPVGSGEKKQSFTAHTIEIKKGDRLYLYTDGYADQFGGPKGKKFKYKALNELILNNHSKTPNEHKQNLVVNFNAWKKHEEQVDDVCVVGLYF